MSIAKILSDINALVVEPASLHGWFACQQCQHTYQGLQAAETCPKCNASAFQWPGENQTEALQRAQRAAGALAAKAPAPTRPRRAAKKKEEVATVTTAATTATPQVVDLAAERLAAIEALIEKLNLNEVSPVPVGEAVVQTVGFTMWRDKKPLYRFHEGFETAQDFAAAYNLARAEQPALRIDVALCSDATNPDLAAVLFRGELIVALNTNTGTRVARRGDTIKIGALKTSTGRLRFVIGDLL